MLCTARSCELTNTALSDNTHSFPAASRTLIKTFLWGGGVGGEGCGIVNDWCITMVVIVELHKSHEFMS